MSSSTKPSAAHIERCQETLTAYIAHYITHARPNQPIDHLIVCAGHPDPKILVTICNAERFNSPSGKLLTPSVDPVAGENVATAAAAATATATASGKKGEEWNDNQIRFNGVGYDIVLKEGPVEEERWVDREGFARLFDATGKKARGDVLFFDLVAFEQEEKAKAREAEESEAREGREREKRAVKNKAKKEKQKARRAAAMAGGDMAVAPNYAGETELLE